MEAEVSFQPVEARVIRLLINSHTGPVQIYEVMLLR